MKFTTAAIWIAAMNSGSKNTQVVNDKIISKSCGSCDVMILIIAIMAIIAILYIAKKD